MKLKPLVKMMAMLPVMALPATTALHASDLSIYKPNSGGKASILLMLDTSGSMGISSLVLPRTNDYGSPGDWLEGQTATDCDVTAVGETGSSSRNFNAYTYNLVGFDSTGKPIKKTSETQDTAIEKSVVIGNATITYHLRGCTNGTRWQYDRLSRLKEAIIPLLASSEIENSVVMGVGAFSTKTDMDISGSPIKLIDSHSGSILVENAALSLTHRAKIAKKIAAFQSFDNISYGNGKKEVAIDEDGEHYIAGNAYKARDLRKSSVSYPIGEKQYKTAGGTPTAHAYAEAGAYMMGTHTDGVTTGGRLSWIYDGSMTMQNINTGKQVHFICVKLGSGRTNSDFKPANVNQDVKQCINNWPSHGGSSVSNATITDGVYKPNPASTNENDKWIHLDTREKLETELTALKKTMSNGWETLDNLPVGWRYGGWMKVEHEPLDIEPIVGKVWGPYANGSAYGIVAYRTNPFSISETSTVATDNNKGGMRYSVAASMNTAKTEYKAGGSTNQCDGNGIYFLTDGAPNSTKNAMAQTIMNHTLGADATYKFLKKPDNTDRLISPPLKTGLFTGETGGWEYIGEYARKLRNKKTDDSPNAKNPKNMGIRTAVVGFGSSFDELKTTTDCEALKRADPINYNKDAYNACKWGSAEYGDGGFYYAENSEDIKKSIIDFVEKVQVPFTPTSLGSISVPRDPLDQTQIMTEGFFPMISPIDDSEAATNNKHMIWAGNLKKYNIVDGTLKDKNNNNVYTDDEKINDRAKDFWSLEEGAVGHSNVLSGGSLNKIPVPSLLNLPGQPSKSDSVRSVYTIDGTTLKKVTLSNIATDVSGGNALSNNISASQRYALLNYLGYVAPIPTTPPTALTTTQVNSLTTVPASPYRHMGGVVHSTPILATKKATISADTNDVTSREEYVVYGSMEGGLHIVDASTGEEKSVFVPKEILTNQFKALVSKDEKGNALVYGVDAPWAIDSQYKVKSTTSGNSVTTAYEASVLRAYGGLRMGGNGFYGLNIKSVTAPELLFHISPSTTGFERLAQTWSKPTITEIRHEGERKRVLIFGGGYDADKYENETVEMLSSGDLPTKGNALYVIDAETGELIWSTSSSISATNTTAETKHDDVKYSVVAQPAVRDYDSDGLTDMIYFADMGGQIFRVDLNNLAHMNTTKKNIAVRVQKIANLAETNFVPRFYDRVTTAVFGSGAERHVFVSVGSGNRSFPLNGASVKNKVYGILDYDAAKNGLEKTTYDTSTLQAVATMGSTSNMLNRGSVGKNSSGANTLTLNGVTVSTSAGKTDINDANKASLLSTGTNRGWYFELISQGDGSPTNNYYAKAFEEPQLVVGDLYVSIYDPKAGTSSSDLCGGGVQGLSTVHRICAPYGDCAAHVTTDYQGIIGSTLGGLTSPARTTQLIGPTKPAAEKCVGRCDPGAQTPTEQVLRQYSQRRVIRPTRWFEW